MLQEHSNQMSTGSLLQELIQPGLYKRSQGRIARQATFGALAVLVAVGCWRLSTFWTSSGSQVLKYGVPGLLLIAGLWLCYRVVNIPSFADFLIAVEGEMAKVSWPSRSELIRSSVVVILTIVLLAAVLYTYDLIWQGLLDWLLGKPKQL